MNYHQYVDEEDDDNSINNGQSCQEIKAIKLMLTYEQNHGHSKAPVLVVDDNTFNTIALQSLLMQFSIESDTASDGNQAVYWVKQRYRTQGNAYKLILLDYSMPECGGIEASMRIKKYLNKHMPKKAQSFICCITAYQREKYEKQAKESGMDYFLSKPVYKQGLG